MFLKLSDSDFSQGSKSVYDLSCFTSGQAFPKQHTVLPGGAVKRASQVLERHVASRSGFPVGNDFKISDSELKGFEERTEVPNLLSDQEEKAEWVFDGMEEGFRLMSENRGWKGQ